MENKAHRDPDREPLSGRVLSGFGTVYLVRHGQQTYTASLAGRLRLENNENFDNPVTIGDRVLFDPLEAPTTGDQPGEANAVIRSLERRTNTLSRHDGRRHALLGANLDQVLVLAAYKRPAIKWNFIFRVLAAAWPDRVPVTIIINKRDQLLREVEERERAWPGSPSDFHQLRRLLTAGPLDSAPDSGEAASSRWRDLEKILTSVEYLEVSKKSADPFVFLRQVAYLRSVGYHFLILSATEDSPEFFARRVRERFSLICGISGVGKSTLVNQFLPAGEKLTTQSVSGSNKKGRQTTTTSRAVELTVGGFMADTPGVKTWGVLHLTRQEILESFRDLDRLAENCRFRDCRHTPTSGGCQIQAALPGDPFLAWRFSAFQEICRSLERPGRIRTGDYWRGTVVDESAGR